MDNMNNSKTQDSGNGAMTPEKTFTQEEVNRIVQERLNRERKTGAESAGLESREQDLNRRELALTAREILMDKGMPKELADILYFTDKESLNKAVEVLETHYRSRPDRGGRMIEEKRLPEGDPDGYGNDREVRTREAFGLD